jgi:hypothetical protein
MKTLRNINWLKNMLGIAVGLYALFAIVTAFENLI